MADFLDQFPALKFHYRVTIDGAQISFSEVSGLDMETEPVEYRSGDSEYFGKQKGAGMLKFSNITMKKGVFETDDRLLELFNAIYEKEYYSSYDSRMDILVELLDETGSTVMAWNITNAFPIKLTGTDLKSDGNEVAIETIEFAHEGNVVSLA